MPLDPPKKRRPGLPGVYQAREMRLAGRFARPTEGVWLALGVALALILGGYRFFSNKSLSAEKETLLAKRRSIVVTVGKEWYPLRDQIEHRTLEEARAYGGDLVDDSVRTLSFRSAPGVYLRLKLDDARDASSIRKASEHSLKDAFTACLLRTNNDALARGEADAGVFPEQPWNLRQAYAATRILTDDWHGEIVAASDPLRLRVFQQQYEKAVEEEIPLAVDILKRARFFLLVLDEDTPAAALADGGSSTAESLQLVPHDARVVVYDFKKSEVVLRLRRTASGSFLPAGDRPIVDEEVRAAAQRQVNNCTLAQAVLARIHAPAPAATGQP